MLRANRRDADAAGLPAINVSAAQGKLLLLLTKLASGRRVFEIGTLGGYSTTWLARGLPADGTVVTLERDPGHAATPATPRPPAAAWTGSPVDPPWKFESERRPSRCEP